MNNFGGAGSAEVAIIPKGTVINGNIEIDGKLDMHGEINGNIVSNDRVNITGTVTGDIKANDLYTRIPLLREKLSVLRVRWCVTTRLYLVTFLRTALKWTVRFRENLT